MLHFNIQKTESSNGRRKTVVLIGCRVYMIDCTSAESVDAMILTFLTNLAYDKRPCFFLSWAFVGLKMIADAFLL